MPRPASTRAWASARAGMRWPPVPPPAINTFMGAPNAECGMRNAEYKGRVESRNETRAAIPHSAFRTPHLGGAVKVLMAGGGAGGHLMPPLAPAPVLPAAGEGNAPPPVGRAAGRRGP